MLSTFGEGIVDFKTVFDRLNAHGFHGPFTMEIEGVEGESLNRSGDLPARGGFGGPPAERRV